jgi:hypothetical protein
MLQSGVSTWALMPRNWTNHAHFNFRNPPRSLGSVINHHSIIYYCPRGIATALSDLTSLQTKNSGEVRANATETGQKFDVKLVSVGEWPLHIAVINL